MGQTNKEKTVSPGAPPSEERKGEDGDLLAEDGSMGAWNEDEDEGTVEADTDRGGGREGYRASPDPADEERAPVSASNAKGGERAQRSAAKRDGEKP
jgi:hypothetical protein